MMNKKGFSFGRLILYILLFGLVCFLVEFIIIAINGLNRTDRVTTDAPLIMDRSISDDPYDLRLVSYTDYNPLDDVNAVYLMAYKNSNFISNTNYYTNIFNYESNSLVYYYYSDGSQGYFSQYNPSQLPTPLSAVSSFKNDNGLDVGRALYYAHSLMNSYGSALGSVRSSAICFDSNIPIEYFNFNMVYNYPINTNISIYFYVMTDNGSKRYAFPFGNGNLIYSFNASLLQTDFPQATKILRFGFGCTQNTNSTNIDNYLPQRNSSVSATTGFNYEGYAYENYYETLSSTQKQNLCYISFDLTALPSDYVNGYTNGYNQAIADSNESISRLNNRIADKDNTISSLESTITQQQNIITDLQNQLNSANTNYKSLFFTIADVPLKTVQNMLGFEVLGVNLFKFFVGIITALGLVWLIRKIAISGK